MGAYHCQILQEEQKKQRIAAIKEQNRILLKKTIYPSRAGKTKEQVMSILNLECETHIRNNPDLVYFYLDTPVVNADKTVTYTLHFRVKK
jgi:hypothetical protein